MTVMDFTLYSTPVYQWIRDCFHSKSKYHYEGSFDVFGKYHKKGILFFENGNFYYKGSFHHGKFHGYGNVYTIDGTLLYQGRWRYGKKNGFGMGNFSDSLCYMGEWKDDYPSGKGTMYQNGFKIYKGSFLDGIYHGFGTEYFARCYCQKEELISYRGFWKSGKYHGLGKKYQYRTDGDNTFNALFYCGHFHSGMKHGQGSVYDEYGRYEVYNGSWKNDLYHGFGCLYNSNRQQIFRGQFKNGFKHGVGFFLDTSSDTFLEKTFFFGHVQMSNHCFSVQIKKFLETRNECHLDFVPTESLKEFLEKQFSVVLSTSSREEIVHLLSEKDTLSKTQIELVDEDTHDLFGNKIVSPVVGSDGGIYNLSSMEYLFEKDENEEYINIPYQYNESGDRVPVFPRMKNGVRLTSYTILHS